MDLFISYYFLPLLLSFLWFWNFVWLLKELKNNRDIRVPTIFGAILSSGLIGSILLSFYLLRF